MMTIAIATRIKKHSCDEFEDVLGFDLTMDEAVKQCQKDFDHLVRQDQKDTKTLYVSVVPIPEKAIDPDDGVAYEHDGKTVVLPEFWENDADVQDIVRDGKLVD